MGKNFASISSQCRSDFWDSSLVTGTKTWQEEGSHTKYEQKQKCFSEGISSSHDVAKHTNIKQSTAKSYIKDMTAFGNWLRDGGQCLDEKGHFDIKLITAEHVGAYLSHKVEENLEKAERGEKLGQCRDTLDNLASEFNKWAVCADRSRGAGLSDSVEKVIVDFRERVLPDMPDHASRIRAYDNPEAVIKELENCPQRSGSDLNARAALVAEIQLRIGLRVDNARCFTLLPKSQISIISKGGMPHPKFDIPRDLYLRAVDFNGGLGRCELIKYETYLGKLENACGRLGVKYSDHSSHGFRHNHAQRYFKELTAKGTSETRAKALVSLDLFHQRLDVVEVYLKQ